MLGLSNVYYTKRNMKNGDDYYTDTSDWTSDNGVLGCVCFEWGGTNSILYFCKNAATRMTTATAHTVRTGDYTGEQSGRIFESNPNGWLTDTTGGALLDLANSFKQYFFNNITQTAHTLFEFMKDNYGECAGFSYTVVQNKAPSEMYGAGQTLSVDWQIGKATATRLVEFNPPATDEISGDNYGTIVIPSEITNWNDAYNYMIAALIFDETITPPRRAILDFHVYVDGSRDPNVAIRWDGDVQTDDFSLQLVTPRVWTLPDSQPSYPYVNEDGILVPNEANPRMRKYVYTFAGQYDNPYLTEFGACTTGMSDLDKVAVYGASGIASRMRYLLRFNMQKNEDNVGVMTWGNCYIVDIPREVSSESDITVTRLNPSENDPAFTDNVYIHIGTPPDDIPDDNDEYPDGQDFDGNPDGVYEDDDIHDFDTGKPTGFSGKALLTKTYALTSLRTQNLGTKLWTQSYFDVLKIQNNPIENVVSMKWFPFSISGTDTEIKIGNVLMGTNGEVVDSIYKFTVGSAYYRSKKSKATFLDCSPYTQIKLHLPYCGIIQLDASEMLNRKITVSYVVDLVSGDCMAFLELDGTALGEKKIPFMSVSGHIGVDIPLTASNRIQAEMRAASTAISAVSGAAAHVIGGDVVGGAVQAAQGALSVAGMDYTTQRTAAHSPACMTHENRTVFMEIWRPAYDEEISTNNGFKSRHGFPTYKYKTIGSLSGFVKCDARTKIDFAMTGRENQMLEELLTSGVYV